MHTATRLTSTAATALLLAGCQTGTQSDTDARGDSAPDQASDLQASPAAFPQGRTATLWVKGLACPYCVHNIEKQLVSMPGVERVHVDLPTGKVRVALEVVSPATRESLTGAIDDSGFTLDRIEMPQ